MESTPDKPEMIDPRKRLGGRKPNPDPLEIDAFLRITRKDEPIASVASEFGTSEDQVTAACFRVHEWLTRLKARNRRNFTFAEWQSALAHLTYEREQAEIEGRVPRGPDPEGEVLKAIGGLLGW